MPVNATKRRRRGKAVRKALEPRGLGNFQGRILEEQTAACRPLRGSVQQAVLLAVFETGTSLLTNGAVDEVFIRARFAHGLQAPIGGGGTYELVHFLVVIIEGTIGGFAAKRVASYLHE